MEELAKVGHHVKGILYPSDALGQTFPTHLARWLGGAGGRTIVPGNVVGIDGDRESQG